MNSPIVMTMIMGEERRPKILDELSPLEGKKVDDLGIGLHGELYSPNDEPLPAGVRKMGWEESTEENYSN